MRKKNIPSSYLLIFLSLILTSFHPLPDDGLILTITRLRNNKGHVLVSLFKEGNGYPDDLEKSFRTAKATITNNTAIINFNGLPAGNYAISMMHDENDDGKMNKNWLGLPKEGYGFSNNVMGTFGPPDYHDAKFTYNGGKLTTIEIKTRY